ncbi:MAG: VPS10 domain-containing protein [Saprospiraceae bacterium]
MAKHPSSLIFAALLLFSCGKNALPHADKLAQKSEPYDQFSFQRSYPDRDFDWQGWRKTMQQTRLSETALARGGAECGTNSTPWAQQGPMNVGARCNTLAVKPDDENTVLAGFAGGGIFKSTDGTANWHPVFDENPELSIGDITFDPSNPNVVYAGTGDPNMPSTVFNGDGIYKSTDAGETWQHFDNGPTGIVSKVLVHPTDPTILWAATMGNPYVRDPQRGIYKSSDGGGTWQQVLFVSEQAGASDLVQSPANPQILYASFWDRIRNNHESVIHGPHGRVYKSTDGGNNWAQLGGGLPTGIQGRTGLAISQTNPDKVYAVYIDSLATPGGLYKTINGGTTWTSMNILQLETSCSDFGWYFGKIRTNPTNDEDLYFHAIQLWRKPAGSTSWTIAGGGHADSHDLVFAPSGRRYWSNDGGVYRSDPGQTGWTKAKNLPVTQFYRSTFNPHDPDKYWAGAQDNGIQKGNGANPNNWTSVFLADGFRCAFDPDNAEHFWVEIQNGAIHETTDGGDSWQFGSVALNSSDRTNWDTPFFMSAHTPNLLYAATYRTYAKNNSGGWAAISGDLTDGNIFGARFHTVSCLNESPTTANKLVAGTSDGNVWRREAAGAWANITAGLPERYVTSVHYSPTLPNRIFVSHSGFRDNEDIPHVHRSDDNGATWQNISSNLPQMPVNDVFVLPGHADQVLFAATDAGVYFTLNGGAAWSRLGGNMPYIPVFDFEHNPVRKELVAATFARGIWTFPLDSVFAQQSPVTVSLAGTVRDSLGEGVVNVGVGGALSGDDGVFVLPNVPGCVTHTLAPYRNDNPLNGLTTYDLVLISKHILNIEPFDSPLKMIAADANRSGSITTFDIVTLRKLILGIDTVLASNTSWRFVPAGHAFPNLQNPFQTAFPETLAVQVLTDPMAQLDFTAIKTGDVNNSAAPHLTATAEERTVGELPILVDWLKSGEVSSATKEQVTSRNGLRATVSDFEVTSPMLGVGDVTSKSGQLVEAIFSAAPSAYAPAMVAAQFTLQFDFEKLVFEKIEPLAPGISMEHFGLNRVGRGLVSFAYSSADLESVGQSPFFKIVFRAKGADQLAESLRLTDWPTASLAYLADGSALRPVLESRGAEEISLVSDRARCWPSPFGGSGVWVGIPAHTPGKPWRARQRNGELLQVFDAQGKLLYSKTMPAEGTAHLEASLFPRAGVYFWRVGGGQSGKFVFAP